MADLLIKNVPDELLGRIRCWAEKRGESLEEYLLYLIKRAIIDAYDPDTLSDEKRTSILENSEMSVVILPAEDGERGG